MKARRGEEELIPAWREFRDLSSKQLADPAGISQAYLSQIEAGKREGSLGTMKKVADALRIGLDDLV